MPDFFPQHFIFHLLPRKTDLVEKILLLEGPEVRRSNSTCLLIFTNYKLCLNKFDISEHFKGTIKV